MSVPASVVRVSVTTPLGTTPASVLRSTCRSTEETTAWVSHATRVTLAASLRADCDACVVLCVFRHEEELVLQELLL